MAFNKYKEYGPYHWAVFAHDPRRHDLFTYTRYHAVLDNAAIMNGMNILDMGCGDGALTFLIFQKYPNSKITGIEPDETGRNLAIKMFAKKRARASFLETSATVPDKSQDVVLCADVIEHISNCDYFLIEINRILKPEGLAVFSTPVRMTEIPQDKEHIKEYFPAEFNQVIKKYFTVKNHYFCTSVFALELYTWKPLIFFKRELIGWIMSFLNISCKINIMKKLNPGTNLWTTQIITAIK
jgi:2-polyprenyl-3-methyl-5-hydroxy-6-metoxy-1,4-benzoquinol methylase